MKYLVHMDVNLPADLPAAEAAEVKAKEKAYSQELQRSGKWPEIWRVVGEYANYSIFDVDSNDELHEILQNLPLFPYMEISVVPLASTPPTSNNRTEPYPRLCSGSVLDPERSREFAAGADAHFPVEPGQVVLHRLLREEQGPGSLLVGGPARHQFGHRALLRSELGVMVAGSGQYGIGWVGQVPDVEARRLKLPVAALHIGGCAE